MFPVYMYKLAELEGSFKVNNMLNALSDTNTCDMLL